MNIQGAFIVALSLMQGFVVRGLTQEASATEIESLLGREGTSHSEAPSVWWHYPGATVELWTSGVNNPAVSYTYPTSGAVYPTMGGIYPSGYPTMGYPGYPSGGYPVGSYPTYPAGVYPNFGRGYPNSGRAYPGSGSAYPGSGSAYPGSGSAYPGTTRGIVPPAGTDNGKIPGGIPVSDEVEIFTVPGRGEYGRIQQVPNRNPF